MTLIRSGERPTVISPVLRCHYNMTIWSPWTGSERPKMLPLLARLGIPGVMRWETRTLYQPNYGHASRLAR
jgi:hypothetical protein